jgi:hypothetical protein
VLAHTRVTFTNKGSYLLLDDARGHTAERAWLSAQLRERDCASKPMLKPTARNLSVRREAHGDRASYCASNCASAIVRATVRARLCERDCASATVRASLCLNQPHATLMYGGRRMATVRATARATVRARLCEQLCERDCASDCASAICASDLLTVLDL